MDTDLYRSLNSGSRTEHAVQLLTDLITTGKLASGDFFPSEPALSKQLGISRATVRMALRTLETRGLVVTRHGVGVQVADRTREVAVDSLELMLQRAGGGTRDMLEVRLMLECQGAALAAERATAADVEAIGAAIDAMRADDLSIDACIDLDLAFHLRLHEASKNPVLVALVHALRGMLRDTIAGTYERDRRTAPRLEEHSRIFAAVKAGDSKGAHDAMATHLHHSVRRPVFASDAG